MTVTVNGPDGVTLQFPDGMDGDAIGRVMAQHFGSPEVKAKVPSFDSDAYVNALAEKHGVAPEFVLRDSQTATAMAGGVPIAGGIVDKAGSYVSAMAQPLTGAGAPGASIGERQQKNLALEQELSVDFQREHPVASTAAGLVGGAVAMAPLAGTALGARLLGLIGGGLGRRALAQAASGAAINTGDAAVRGNDLGSAALIGGGVGGLAPVGAKAIGTALSPIVSNIEARVNPASYAGRQVARAITESGQTPEQIARQVSGAAAEGQGMFTVADAMGNPGQRMLSTIARAPGEGRTDGVNFLDARQAGQGRRVANTLAEGFQAPETAARTEERLRFDRMVEANRNYGAARQGAGSVDVTPVIEHLDQTLQPGVTRMLNPQSGIADDSIEAVMRRARGLLTDGRSQVSRFPEAFRVKQEFDNLIDRAPPTAQRLLIPARNLLDDQLSAASPLYRAARDRFRQQSQEIEAVALGRRASQRGRVENTIPEFQGLTPGQQAPYRSGYVDPLIERVQGAAAGANKARELTSDAFHAEAGAVAPGAPQMMRRLGRENTMFETRAQATGGSRTADNLADAAAMGHAPELAAHILSGNVAGLARNALGFVARGLTGNTPAVRQEAARLLLMRGGTVTAQDLQTILNSARNMVRARESFSRRAIGIAARTGAQQISGGNRQQQ
jgi:hypothetical protein